MQEKVHWAELRWDLKNRVTIYQRADKAVYSAESTKWGQVILKVNENKEELFSEYNMLKLMVGENSCKVFAYDKAHSVLVEERIMPGNRLKEEQDVAVRMAHFLRVFSNIHQSVEHDQTFTTYLDWLKEAEMFCRQHDVEEWIKAYMCSAYEMGEELWIKYRERVLLHGDLHHENMLLNERGTYSIIDPKGVIGPEIFDLPRYILNERDFIEEKACEEYIISIVKMISKALDYPIEDILKVYFIEVMLANVWCIEDGELPDLSQIEIAVKLAFK